MLKPKLFTTLKDYTRPQFVSDLIAGTIVGVVALPLAIAFAIASGVSPDKGLLTAVIAGFLISALGGSRVQIGGPTGAFVVIVYSIVQKHGLDGLTISCIMAGVILVIMGFAGFGSMIKFIPYPVVVGFTSGIAVIIFSSQIKDFFGLQMGAVPSAFIDKWMDYAAHFSSLNLYALGIGAASMAVILLWPRVTRKVPGSLIVLIGATAAAAFFNLPVETIGSRFGSIPSSIPAPSLPDFDLDLIRSLVRPATTIAILAGIESLLSAVVADGMIGGKHRSNMELVANGVANIVCPLFGGIPATGAIARTATNIKNGGRTPVAGMVHALVLLFIMFFFGRWAALIPLSCLAAILAVVSYNMSEWRSFMALLKGPRSDVAVLLTTFGLTVIMDLTVAIEVGMVLAAFLFMRRMALVTNVDQITADVAEDLDDAKEDSPAPAAKTLPAGVQIYEINGPLFFGAAYKFEEAIKTVDNKARVLIIRLRHVPSIDSTGLHTLENVLKNCRKNKIRLILAEAPSRVRKTLESSEFIQKIGPENILSTLNKALDEVRPAA